jgi:outer membrane protein assembly factor BamB
MKRPRERLLFALLIAVAVAVVVVLPFPAVAEKPAEKNGSVFVSTVPPLAVQVLVDSEPRGKAPLQVRQLAPGDHLVEVTFEGYGRVERVVTVEVGKEIPVTIPLTKDVGRLRVEAPPGSPVYLDGRYVGKAPGPLWVPHGAHKARVVCIGLPSFTADVQIEPGKEAILESHFEARLRIETTPPGVHVSVDGKDEGQSPLSLKVSPGKHKISINEAKFDLVEQEAVAELAKEEKVEIALRASRRVWAAQLGEVGGAPLLTAGLSLWKTSGSVVALDPKSGERRWEYKPSIGGVEKMRLHGDLLYLTQGLGKNGAVVALKVEEGKEVWRAETVGTLTSVPLFADKPPRVVAATQAGHVYVWEPATGKVLWEHQVDKMLGIPTGTPVAIGDRVCFTTNQGWTFGLDPRGRLDWKFRIGSVPPPAPSGTAAALLVWGAWSKAPRSMVYSLDGRSGAKQWSYVVNGPPAASLVSIGEVALAREGKQLIGIRLKGGKAFSVDVGDAPAALLPLGGGALLVGESSLRRVDVATGKQLWETPLTNACAPALAGKQIFVGAGSELIALDAADGRRLWSYRAPGRVCRVAVDGDAVLLATGGAAYRIDASPGATK